MNRTLILCLTASVLGACTTTPDYNRSLADGESALIAIAERDIPDFSHEWAARTEMLPALDNSIAWTRRKHAEQFFPMAGITHARALASLERFREILTTARSHSEFQSSIASEFTVYKSAGWDGQGGGVLFTAYCTPILDGSLEAAHGFDYPLYALPPDLVKGKDGMTLGWDTPMGRMDQYPSRGAIEAGGLLKDRGLELVWLKDPIDAYIAHVNGSAFIRLRDGTLFRVGYAGKNGRTYRSLGKALERSGSIKRGEASLATIREWAARTTTAQVQAELANNEAYIFFVPIEGNPHGSLDVEVTAARSVATDKTLFPRGALVYVDAPDDAETDAPVRRFYLDQDTGGAIQTAGRADLYLGIGPWAESVSGSTKLEGQMYYLFLREG